ncbi:18347_t:CDS:2, partial [Acaulospora morrowiae]
NPEMANAYEVPKYFQVDLFETLSEKRPPHRWMIIGPERSGASWHVDPSGTSGMNYSQQLFQILLNESFNIIRISFSVEHTSYWKKTMGFISTTCFSTGYIFAIFFPDKRCFKRSYTETKLYKDYLVWRKEIFGKIEAQLKMMLDEQD